MISITRMRDAAGGAVIRLVIRMDQTVDSGWIWNEGNGDWRGNKRSQGKAARKAPIRAASYAGDTGYDIVEDMRRHISPEDGPPILDAELYDALPRLLQGHVWAGYVD